MEVMEKNLSKWQSVKELKKKYDQFVRNIKKIDDLLGKKEEAWRDATYYRYWMHMAHNLGNPAHFGIRTQKYKLIFFYGVDYEDPPRTDYWGSQADIITPPGWELYDIQADPHEMKNLYGRSEYSEIIKALKAKLKVLREELNETDAKYPHIQKIIDEHWND